MAVEHEVAISWEGGQGAVFTCSRSWLTIRGSGRPVRLVDPCELAELQRLLAHCIDEAASKSKFIRASRIGGRDIIVRRDRDEDSFYFSEAGGTTEYAISTAYCHDLYRRLCVVAGLEFQRHPLDDSWNWRLDTTPQGWLRFTQRTEDESVALDQAAATSLAQLLRRVLGLHHEQRRSKQSMFVAGAGSQQVTLSVDKVPFCVLAFQRDPCQPLAMRLPFSSLAQLAELVEERLALQPAGAP